MLANYMTSIHYNEGFHNHMIFVKSEITKLYTPSCVYV